MISQNRKFRDSAIVFFRNSQNQRSTIQVNYHDWVELKKIAALEQLTIDKMLRVIDDARPVGVHLAEALGVFHTAYSYACGDSYAELTGKLLS